MYGNLTLFRIARAAIDRVAGAKLPTGFSVRESGTQARTGNEYGTGTRGTGSECEARGVMGRRKIELRFPAPPHHFPRPRSAFRFIFRAGDWGRGRVRSPCVTPRSRARAVSLSRPVQG